MIGLERKMPDGYRGFVFRRAPNQGADQAYLGNQKIPL